MWFAVVVAEKSFSVVYVLLLQSVIRSFNAWCGALSNTRISEFRMQISDTRVKYTNVRSDSVITNNYVRHTFQLYALIPD